VKELLTDKPGQEPVLFNFLSRVSRVPWSTDLRVLGVLRGLRPVAVVGYNGWVGDGVFMHVALEDEYSMTRNLLREAFVYPFITCGKSTVYTSTPITNEEAIRVSLKLGFKEIAKTPDFALFQMTFEECRWINGRRQFSSSSTGLRSSS
jgi:hypothetical protein